MHWGQWTFWDYAFILIILLSTVLATMKGLVREVISLAALVGGFVLAILYYPALGTMISELSKTEAIANFAGFLTIFLGVLLMGAIASFAVNRLLKAVSLQWIDRLLGALFGLLRGWAVASILMLALIAFPVREGIMSRSFLAPYLLAGARAAVLVVPQDLKHKFNNQYQRVLQELNRSTTTS